MLWRLILLLTLVPLVELLLLVRLTQLWGSFALTVLIIVGTGLIGAVLARREGLRVLGRVQERLRRGELPADGLVDGVLILLAGALLITPGLITDAAGFLLLIPPSRAAVRALLKRRIRRMITEGQATVWGTRWRPIDDEPPPGAPPMEDDD
ncbi:MAG: hypothetical protein AMK73_08375 [Planctomycetes bacterium SM23_32]|nr:MAG: hypothetical protein AMK73_08375 [Planctomycetes bacterium SM23_32]